MSEAALYQSVLQKLGQLSPQHLAELDAFLAVLVEKQEGLKQIKSQNLVLESTKLKSVMILMRHWRALKITCR